MYFLKYSTQPKESWNSLAKLKSRIVLESNLIIRKLNPEIKRKHKKGRKIIQKSGFITKKQTRIHRHKS
jgi:hypothetical protein